MTFLRTLSPEGPGPRWSTRDGRPPHSLPGSSRALHRCRSQCWRWARQRRLPVFRTPMITMNFREHGHALRRQRGLPPATTEQGTSVDSGASACSSGDSGVGKSECATGAGRARPQPSWRDDITVIKLLSTSASSWPAAAASHRGYMECRGIGIINIAEMFRHQKASASRNASTCVVSLREWTPSHRGNAPAWRRNFLRDPRIKLPHIELYVRPGRDIARLVEVAAMVRP